MKRILPVSLILAAALAASGLFAGSPAAIAEDAWLFKRSYYSHDPVSDVRIGRQFSTGPVFTRPQGQYVRSGFRQIHSTIVTQGQTYDNLNVYDTWVQTGNKF